MFAIIKSGGRQVKVTPGAVVEVDRVQLAAGDKVTIDQVLFVGKDDGSMLSGAPFVAGAKVLGVIAGESRGPKIRVFKKRRRKTMRVDRPEGPPGGRLPGQQVFGRLTCLRSSRAADARSGWPRARSSKSTASRSSPATR